MEMRFAWMVNLIKNKNIAKKNNLNVQTSGQMAPIKMKKKGTEFPSFVNFEQQMAATGFRPLLAFYIIYFCCRLRIGGPLL